MFLADDVARSTPYLKCKMMQKYGTKGAASVIDLRDPCFSFEGRHFQAE